MKCFTHLNEAGAVCAYCGRALCPECVHSRTAPRLVCSSGCAAALERGERAIQLILQKSVQSLQASAFYCYLCGGVSASAAVIAWFTLPSTFLMFFAGGCSVVLVASGFWYGRAARRQLPA